MRILFACDLDNTLIYSYKHKHEGDICIEILKDKEQGFMSRNTCSLLKRVINMVNFIPVTTRSIEQYSRIKWADSPAYAVSTNGAVLLKDYVKDEEWFEKSRSYSGAVYDEMIKLRDFLISEDKFIRCRIVDDMYLFAYCKDGTDIKKCTHEYMQLTALNVISSGKKIYFFPNEINKGAAVIRLKEKFSPDIIICAGDSEIDIPMLNIADIAIVPSDYLAGKITCKNIYINNTDNFPEFVLKTVLDAAETNR